MPYRSQAQQRMFHALLAKGKISKATVDEYDKATDFKKLPKKKKKKPSNISHVKEDTPDDYIDT